MTDKARETIAEILFDKQIRRVTNLPKIADAILAALPEIIAGMVEPLVVEPKSVEGCMGWQVGEFEGYQNFWRRTGYPGWNSEDGMQRAVEASTRAANAHYRDQCCAPFRKAPGMKEGE